MSIIESLSKDIIDINKIVRLLEGESQEELFAAADKVREVTKGNIIDVRAILEFSNYCKRECAYCGLNCYNTKLERFRLTENEIIEYTVSAHEVGYKTIVLQSGEDNFFTGSIISNIISKIKERCDIAITLSLGERTFEELADWKGRGADRYLLKHETADKLLYERMHSKSQLIDRVNVLKNIKKLGYETGSGFMIGLPGQTTASIAEDILLLRELQCDMAGISPFIPSPDTELANCSGGDNLIVHRALAITRLLMPNINLPLTTALSVSSNNDELMAFEYGANVVMNKVTPSRLQKLYTIYPRNVEEMDIRISREKLLEKLRLHNRIGN